MNLLYKNNIKALQQNSNFFISKKPSSVNYDIDILDSKDGNNTLLFNNDNKKLYLHSKYSPIKEAILQVENIDFLNVKMILVFGFGLGYHIQQIINKMNKDTKLIIVEPSKTIFEKSIENFDFINIPYKKTFI